MDFVHQQSGLPNATFLAHATVASKLQDFAQKGSEGSYPGPAIFKGLTQLVTLI